MDWRDEASCHEDRLCDPELFYPIGDIDRVGGAPWTQGLEAKRVCSGCPVRLECLASAIEHERGLSIGYRYGVWGGLTPAERIEYERGTRGAQVSIPAAA